MNKATKALLLSALLFPGAGHFYLKRYILGTLFASIAALALYLFTRELVDISLALVEQIQNGELALDVEQITQAINERFSRNSAFPNYSTSVLVGCWLLAMLDAYRAGRLVSE